MKLCIFGSREIDKSFCDIETIVKNTEIGVTREVSGTAIGADLIGEWWAVKNGIPIDRFPAQWERHGKTAGHTRNKEMHDYCDAGVALWDGVSSGTAHMIKLFQESQKPLWIEKFDLLKIFGCKVCSREADIFVFGSNEAGKHSKGSALHAKLHHGAIYSKGSGIQGKSFAVPTKSKSFQILKISEIQCYVKIFLEYAENNKNVRFYISNIGSGLASFSKEEIAPLFLTASPNCIFSDEWGLYLGRNLL